MRRTSLVLTVALLLGLCACSASTKSETIRINEVQTSGECDWIELYNHGTSPIHLGGFFLSDDPDSLGKWQFPDLTLGAGKYLVVYADRSASTEERLSLPFSLKSSGETIVLSNKNGIPVHSVNVPESAPGVSYGYNETDVLTWYAAPTPGHANENGMPMGSAFVNERYGIRINEYMSRNRSVLYDRDGDYGDWVELHNFSDRDIDLGGYYLTDSKDTTTRWQIPSSTVVPADGYLVIFCSGKNRTDGELHTSFQLGQDDSFLGLYTADGLFCSGLTCEPTEQDVSVAFLRNGQFAVTHFPTPGYENTEGGRAQ